MSDKTAVLHGSVRCDGTVALLITYVTETDRGGQLKRNYKGFSYNIRDNPNVLGCQTECPTFTFSENGRYHFWHFILLAAPWLSLTYHFYRWCIYSIQRFSGWICGDTALELTLAACLSKIAKVWMELPPSFGLPWDKRRKWVPLVVFFYDEFRTVWLEINTLGQIFKKIYLRT